MWQTGLFVVIMGITFFAVFRNQDLSGVLRAIGKMKKTDLVAAVFLAVGYVSAEGWMIWYLLRSVHGQNSIFRCISYSFIGFFFSGITPSASGGQPMQLYYMKKDGNALSVSSVILMTVALLYKVVLVLLGAGIGLLWCMPLKEYLKGYYGLYFLGLFCNAAFVGIFSGKSLLVSMCVTRGVSFYLNLLLGLAVLVIRIMGGRKKNI